MSSILHPDQRYFIRGNSVSNYFQHESQFLKGKKKVMVLPIRVENSLTVLITTNDGLVRK